MPELPDVELYVSLLKRRLIGKRMESAKTTNPFVLRSVTPSLKDLTDRTVVDIRRLGKRIVLEFNGEVFVVIHLMIAGRFRWADGPNAKSPIGGKIVSAMFQFENGTLFLTEAGSKKRASLTLVQGESELKLHDPGGIDPISCTLEEFQANLTRENHSVKDVLSNPHLFSGIGNAYSDEILHAAKLSPLKKPQTLSLAEIAELHEKTRAVLVHWTEKLAKEFGDKFPGAGDVTAFRPDFAVHGKFGKPCPVCGKPVQRICYSDNESNYCAQCQNGGKLLADRALSRLLKGDWPRTLDDT